MKLQEFYNKTTKKELFEIAYNFAMLQADENEKAAFEILENEKELIKYYTTAPDQSSL